ncbi:MAG TPA: hypothetical protein VH518_03465 [Tepidisphaeraceae bacterium]
MSPIQRNQLQTATSTRLPDVDSDAILKYLTHRQHIHPRQSIREALDETTELFGCCPEAIVRGITWLGIDPARTIGRLRRSELVQLAKAVHRFWMQNAAATVAASQTSTT